MGKQGCLSTCSNLFWIFQHGFTFIKRIVHISSQSKVLNLGCNLKTDYLLYLYPFKLLRKPPVIMCLSLISTQWSCVYLQPTSSDHVTASNLISVVQNGFWKWVVFMFLSISFKFIFLKIKMELWIGTTQIFIFWSREQLL